MNVMERIRPGTVYFGDCLEVMTSWIQNQVDLIYLDPPFNSKKNYNILFGTETNGKSSQFLAFEDTWQWDRPAQRRLDQFRGAVAHPASAAVLGLHSVLGDSGMMSYLSYMAERLYHAHRVLKATGSIYLHCDPNASHYLKVIMDQICGAENFQNEFIWYYGGGGASKKRWARKHDVLLFYTKSSEWTFNADAVRSKHKWDRGQKRADGSERSLDKGKLPDDVFQHHSLMPWSKERLGYPTQKPLALLERIVAASSKEGDLILDPFCGCGTAVVAAHQLGRRWAGIDISPFAVEHVIKVRLNKLRVRAKTDGIPFDMASARALAKADPFRFEAWAVNQIPGMAPNTKQTGDEGIDGRGTLLSEADETDHRIVLAQVKGGSGGPSADAVRAFCQVVSNPKNAAVAGIFITLERRWSSKMLAEFERFGQFRLKGGAEYFPRLQFWSIEDHFDGKRPVLPSLTDPVTGREMSHPLWIDRR